MKIDQSENKEQELLRYEKQISNSQKQLKKLREEIKNERQKLNKIQLRVPQFLIIGVQKGGTTWLHENLKKHPQILLPRKKEMEFFSYYNKRIEEEDGIAGYLHNFNKIGDILKDENTIKIAGEATPSYFWSIDKNRKWSNPPHKFNHHIPESVKNLLGSKTKLILCLREPVQRAISAYLHHVRFGRINYKNQRILDVGHLYGIIDIGFYFKHMIHWLEKFTLDNFKILIYEENLKREKQQTIKDICDFLNVDYMLYPNFLEIENYHNKGLEYRFDKKEGVFIVESDDSNEFLIINKEEINTLKSIYYDDLLSFQKLIGRYVDDWNE